MAAVRHVEEIDIVTFWRDVHDALVTCCNLSARDAADLIGRLRVSLSCQSELGRLLVYHQSVPDAAYDIWRSTPGGDGREDLRKELQRWYLARLPSR